MTSAAEKAKETRKRNRTARENALKRNEETREKVRNFCEGILDNPNRSTSEKLQACDLLIQVARY